MTNDPTPEAIKAAKRITRPQYGKIDRYAAARIIDEETEPLRKALEQCRVAARIANPEYRIERTDEIVNAVLRKGTPQ